jgi:hypothetical protein
LIMARSNRSMVRSEGRVGEIARWRRALLTIALAYALTLKLVFGGLAATDMPLADTATAGVICHDPSGDTGIPDSPARHHCDDCCLSCGSMALDASLAPPSSLAFTLPLDLIGRRIAHAAAPHGPPVEAWSQAQPQRGPPRA